MATLAEIKRFFGTFKVSNLKIENFTSKTIRKTVAGEEGIRKIAQKDDSELLPGSLVDFLGSIWNAICNFTGWLVMGTINGIGFSFSAAWAWLSSRLLELYYFNWNITDSEIDQLLAQQKVILASYLGGAAGNLAGYLVCGIVPSAAIMLFNEPLGAYLLKEVGEEAFDEFMGNLQLIIRASLKMAQQRTVFEIFKNVRKWTREYVKDPNSANSRFVRGLFGSGFENALRSWGAQGSKPWSFAIAVQERIEAIEDPAEEAFWEEFVEEAIDACIEAGYVVAGGIDAWVAQQKLAETSQFGRNEIVEITPNREAEQEKIILAAPRELLKPELIATMREHVMLDNRDVGMWVGEPVRVELRPEPISIDLRIILNEIQFAPYVNLEGKKSKRIQITVPNVDRAKIDWQGIKLAAGGNNGYLWGRFLALGKFSDGNKMQVYGATADEAKDRLKACAAFNKSELITLTVTEELKEGRRLTYKALYKEPVRIYPIAFTIINQQRILNEESGRASLSGMYKTKSSLISLNVPAKPDNFEETIAELFRIPGAND